MNEPRFFTRRGPFPVTEIARLVEAELRSSEYGDRDIYDVAPLDESSAGDLSFFDSPRFLEALESCQAGAVLVTPKFSKKVPAICAALVVPEPQRSFAMMIAHFYPDATKSTGEFGGEGVVENGAHIHSTAQLEDGVKIAPGAVIGANVEIGRNTVIGANAVISTGSTIGRDCLVGPGAIVSYAMIGDQVIIHSGVKIGQDGYGFVMGPQGHLKIPQIGRVIIQRDVEIGANSTIDRGALRDTIIGEGTKIDNQVQIAHNVVIGRHCIIVAQTGLSGSVVLEDYVAIGGQVGVIPHVRIGAGAQVAASSRVRSDVPSGARWGGTPAKPVREWFREVTALKKLGEEFGRKKKSGEKKT